MKVLLLGSTGFIGANIFEELILKEIDFITISRTEWDMNDPQSEVPYMSNITHIINAAGCTDFFSKKNHQLNFEAPLKLFKTYPDIPIIHFGTSWTKYVNELQTPYLNAKAALEGAAMMFPNVTLVKPSIVSGIESGYHHLDQFWGFGIWAAKTDCYNDLQGVNWDLVPADWCAQIVVEMLGRDKLRFREYDLAQGLTACRLADILNPFREIQIIGGLDEVTAKKVRRAEKMYRTYIEMEGTFDNNNLFFDDFKMPPSVADIVQRWVDRLEPKTIQWRIE